jgi:hypothetical protein
MDEINYSFKQQGQLHLLDSKPNYNIAFHNNGQEIGKLDFNGPALVFTGDAEESAKVFIDWIARSFHGRLEEERKAEREACAKVCEGWTRTPETNGVELTLAAAAIRARGNT